MLIVDKLGEGNFEELISKFRILARKTIRIGQDDFHEIELISKDVIKLIVH